jgi:hypothetical protein
MSGWPAQNADSVLSFGSMGFPRLQGWAITGLGGFFSRYFYFFGPGLRPAPASVLAHLLRGLYYRRPIRFDQRRHLLGIGLNPENRAFLAEDPAFAAIDQPEVMATWFQQAYLDPLQDSHGHLSHHALCVLLYNKTYMQGSANRTTVLSSLLQGRAIHLPFASLDLLELMTRLRPDWRYVYYGKYPNLAVGRRHVALPEYILRRNDPPDSDSSGLIYRSLARNAPFAACLEDTLDRADLERYRGILHPRTLQDLDVQRRARPIQGNALLLRLAWVESMLSRYSLR